MGIDVPAEGATRRWQLRIDVGFAAAFLIVVGGVTAVSALWAWLPATGLLGVALALRHHRVRLMIGFALLAALLQVITEDVAFLADLAYVVLFFTLGDHPARRVRWFGASAAVSAALVSGAFFAFTDQLGGPDLSVIVIAVLGTAVITVGGWVAGYVRWLGRRALQASADAQLAAVEKRRVQDAADQEHERSQIAADMHDVVAHSWAVVAAQADGARYAMQDSPEAADRALLVISETARSSITDLRTILARLRYQESSGTTPGYEQQHQLFTRMRASGMILVDSQVGHVNDSPLMALTAYRLLSEALTNALKHGDLGEPVQLAQNWTNGYRLTVANALSPRGGGDGAGQGIRGMKERAAVVGGTVSSRQVEDRWLLEVSFPAINSEVEAE